MNRLHTKTVNPTLTRIQVEESVEIVPTLTQTKKSGNIEIEDRTTDCESSTSL